jgi:hypothetical protein
MAREAAAPNKVPDDGARLRCGAQRFKQFVGERMGLSLEQAIDRNRSDDASVYEVLDRFVGWASSLKVYVRGSESVIQLMPHTIDAFEIGSKGIEESDREVMTLKNPIQSAMNAREPSQMTMAVEQVEKSLKDGLEFVANLPNGKVVVGM